jgi:chitodextrinase/glucose/arabinose dehydrogenase
MSHLRSLRLLVSFLLGSVTVSRAVTPGLDTPVPVAPYFGGKFPSTAPGDPSGWTVVNAFPNLTFTDPMMLREIPGQSQFLVVGKNGEIWRFPKSASATMAQRVQVLDLTAPTQTSEDQGMYSLAFHPKFGQAGQTGENYVYVCYSRKGVMGSSNPDASYWTLSRFTWVPATGTINPASELIMMSQFDPHRFHNGGALFFGNDGYLYVTVGDGGASADTFNNAQRLNMGFFSGVLRIDVNYTAATPGSSHAIRRQPQDDPNWSYLGVSMARPSGWPASYSQGYGIPNDNPWQSPGGTALEEFYAVGLRSPHSANYDATTGDIWIGDVGQTSWEELSRVVKGSNCQWSYKEGPEQSSYRNDPNTLVDVETAPLYTYDHTVGNSIIGGMRYRGTRWASQLGGKVLFGDHGRGRIWNTTVPAAGGTPIVTEMLSTFHTGPKKGLANFSTDSAGEIYMMDIDGTNNATGRIMKLAEPAVTAEPPQFLSQIGVFSDLATLTPAAGVIPYDVPNALWSDGAHKSRWIIVPNDGAYNSAAEDVVFSAKGNWVFPAGTVFVKHFEVPINANNPSAMKRLETRFLICTAGGGKYGVTYKWNAAGTDAERMQIGLNETYAYNTGSSIEQRTWSYPSRGDCMVCHNDVAGQALGVRTGTLNSSIYYPTTGRSANQLETFNSLGMFDVTLTSTQIEDFIESRSLDDTTAPLEHRVHSYIDTNCSHCHQPGAQGEGFDARLATPLVEENLINGVPTRYEELGAAGRYIKPGNPSLSAVYVRAAAAGNGDAMPPLAKNIAHAQGVAALQTYIQGLTEPEFQPTLGPGPQARYVRLKSITGRRRYAAVAEFSILDANGERIPAGQITASYVRENGSGGFEAGPLVEGSYPAEATDGNDGASTNFWQSPSVGGTSAPNHPHYLVFDLGTTREVGGYKYFPRLTSEDGRIFQYQVDYSTNGTTWTTWDAGTWPNSATAQEFNPGYNKRRARVSVAAPAQVMGPFDMTIAFDMDVENFAASDIVVTGGSVQKLRGSGYYYVASIAPSTGSTNVQVSIPADSVDPVFKTGKGRLGKGNRASTTLSLAVVPDNVPPSQPGNLAANPDVQSVALTWNASPDADVIGYRIRRGTQELATVQATAYTDTGLDPATSYLYRVAAVDDAGNISSEAQITVSTDPDLVPPSTPGSLAAAPEETTVDLSWTASTDNVAVDEYRIERGSTVLATVQGLSFQDAGLNDGTGYTYKVIAIDTSGRESVPATISVTTKPDASPPNPPENLAVEKHVTSLKLTWSVPFDNIGVTSYQVIRDTHPIATVTGTSYEDDGLDPNTAYVYKVRALDARGNISADATISATTDPDVVAPTVPGNLAGNPHMNSIDLSWSASSDGDGSGVDRYRISRNGSIIGSATGLSFSDTALESGIEYHYQVAAIDEAGNVSAAATLSIETTSDSVAPGPPGDLIAGPDYTAVNLSWTAATDNVGVVGYEVYRGEEETPIATVSTLSYTVSGLASNASYTFKVKAKDAANLLSAPATVTVETLGFDDWLTAHELAGQSTADSDGGGLDNFAEFRLGMDPNDPLDDLTFRLECTMGPSAIQIVCPELKPAGHYYLHASGELADIAAVENRIVSLSPEDIAALPPEQRDHYVVEIPAVDGRKFVVLIFEPLPE